MSAHNHKISQETFDETLLENQEVFELSEQDAIEETISQFKQQGIDNLEAYVITSHPESEIGIQERHTRKKFEVHLNVLDECVAQDGTVALDENGIGSKQVETIVNALEGVLNYCNGTEEDVNITGDTKYDKAMPFLTLFHSSSSLYTLMSFLGIVNDGDSKPTEEQMIVLNKVVKVMTAILSPRKSSEREIKTLIKDRFVAMERLLILISLFANLCKQCDSRQDEFVETLKNLVKLASVSCRHSERNKVSFVRAFKNSNQNMEKTSSITLLIRGLMVAVEAYKQDFAKKSGVVSLLTEFCKLISVLCRYDDFRPEGTGGALGVDSSYGMNVSSSHDHVMEFNRNGVVPVLHEITVIALTMDVDKMKESMDGTTTEDDIVYLAGAALSATRVLAVNDEIVQALVAVGVLKVVKMALEMGVKEVLEGGQKQEEIKVHRQHLTAGVIGLVRNLCGNDEIKTTLCLGGPSDPSSSSLFLVLEGMRLYRDNASIQEHGLGTLAAM